MAAVVGRPNPLGAALAASRERRSAGEPVCWQVPLVPELLWRLEPIFSLARDEDVDAELVATSSQVAALSADERRFAADFVAYRLLGEERARASRERLQRYERLAAALGAPGAEIDAFEPEPLTPGERAAELAGVLGDAARAAAQWAAGAFVKPPPPTGRAPGALLIGAYGGEHIGDMAILGGVLFRLHRRYGTERAVLLSQRPVHTRRLVAMLETPVAVTVEGHTREAAREALAGLDLVAFAGGPLMDLPKQLVMHAHTVALARRAGKPFVAEGIGAGPFKRRPSEWVARRLVRRAERLCVRTSADAEQRLVRDLAPEVDRDPAFDYLATRGDTLTRLSERDRAAVDALLEDAEGRLTIGLNLRPIRDLFTENAPGADRAGWTRFVEHRFEVRLAEALGRLRADLAKPPRVVFFPMNAIQFGSSDLRCAYRVARLVGKDVDYRVWQDDAGLDGVVALLRRLDVVVAMRFHANIFALSQQRPVVGIDYRPGAPDKVHALLHDLGRAEDCSRIDRMTSEWLYSRLRSAVPEERLGRRAQTIA